MQTPLLILIRAYRLLFSPWFGNQCRFHPTCSVYAEQAIRVHGSVKGLQLTVARLAKCHPWHPGGLDPIPQSSAKHK